MRSDATLDAMPTATLRLAGEGTLPEAPARTWRPRNNWTPGGEEPMDAIAEVESALQHVERQFENLKILLHLDDPRHDPHHGPRAA
jgi:hypothetical protein